jgi:hypothetical protein
MEVVRELRRKQDELRSDRQALIDKIAKIDTDIGSVDTVIQIYEPDHTPTKAKNASRWHTHRIPRRTVRRRQPVCAHSEHASPCADADFIPRMCDPGGIPKERSGRRP